MRKITSVVFICLATAFHSFSQNNTNTLLWRISGNGLQKPSYLFGTMHLTDDRLFDLGDSLLRAIEISEGFAIEINPDDFSPFIADEIKKEITKQRLIKDVLSKNDFQKYSAALSKKLKKPANEITTRDVFKEKNKWIDESFQKGKNPDFLDAYLFDLARRQGKWMGGVEDISDQAGLLDDAIDESDIKQIVVTDESARQSGMNSLIEAYVNGDLNAIESIMNLSDSVYRDALLTKRNRKMSWRMDSLSHVRSMVFAVGAAHLPGKDGLISLLRKRGFMVEPVFYSKKIKSVDYKIKEIEIPWVDVNDPNGFYKIKMPGKASDMQLYGVVNMKIHFDVFTSTLFMTCSINTPYDENGIDSVMGVFANNVFKDKKMLSAKKVTIENISGKELEKNDEEGYRHGYILYKNNVLYMTVAFSRSNKPQALQDIKRFLGSYHPIENKITDDQSQRMYDFSDSTFAYSLKLPSAPQPGNELIQKPDKSIRSDLKICIDQQSGSYFIFGVNEARPGFSLSNDSATLEKLHETAKNKYLKVWRDTSYLKNHHRVLEMEGQMAEAKVNAKSYYEMRGNRWYAIIAMYMPGKPNVMIDKVLSSFKLLDYPQAKWQTENAADLMFSTWSPSKISFLDGKDTNDDSKLERYNLYDSTRANSYVIVREGFEKYFWKHNDSALWESLARNVLSYNDTLLSRKAIHNGNFSGIEIEKKEKSSMQVARKRMLLYGDTLYTLSTTQPEEDIHNADVNRFYEEFSFKKAAPASHIFQSKMKVLLDDLLSQDSTTFQLASNALSDTKAEKEDISILHAAILKPYKKEEYYYQSINEKIAEMITQLHDSSSLIFARENYLLTTDHDVKTALLNIISSFKTIDNFKNMTELLLKSPPSSKPSYIFRNNLKDSLSLTASLLYPSILTLITDTAISYSLFDVSSTLLDSNKLSVDIFRKYEPAILAFAQKLYTALKKDSSNYQYDDVHLLHVIQKFNDKAANDMLAKWITINENYLRLECVGLLLSNKQAVNQTALVKLAKDKSYRVNLYRSLLKYNRQAIFPKEYLSQRQFAESLIYSSSSEDDEDIVVDKIILVSQKTATFKNRLAKFYFFKISLSEDNSQYRLACAGPFSTNPSDMSIKNAFAKINYKEDYDPNHLKEQSDALIKEMNEENLTEEE